jgi:hypothetical protein
MIDEDDCGAIGGMKIDWQGKPKYCNFSPPYDFMMGYIIN